MKQCLSKLGIFSATLLFSQFTYAAAFQLYELATPVVGTAGVGQAAIANDASTAYFNPAGMTALPASEVMLGTQIILPYANFSPNNNTTILGNNGRNAGVLAPGIGAYYVYDATPDLKLGVSLTGPYAGALNYTDHWVGRYNVQQMQFYTLNFNPAIAYQFNHWFALGAGFSIEYANLNQTIAAPIVPQLLDGQVTVKGDNFSPGFNLGMLLTPSMMTKIGIAFRSQIVHHLRGNVDFLNFAITPGATARMTMPSNIIASIAQDIGNCFTLLGELGWADWSSMRNNIVTVKNFTAVIPQNWHDTYRLGLGGQYKFTPDFLLQAGLSYDSSPTSASRRLPELPMDRQIRAGLGIEYTMLRVATLGLSYEYVNFGNASINNTSRFGVLSGDYSRNFGNFFQASLNVIC